MIKLKRWFFKTLGYTPLDMPMVQYWKHKAAASAKVFQDSDGALKMKIEGEKEIFPGYPRGYLLFGKLSKLKHEIKNQIFNDSWRMLDENKTISDYVVDKVLPRIVDLSKETQYDMVPPERMVPAVREIHRAWTKVSPNTPRLRDILCFILQEDDSYRFRVQWLVPFFGVFPKRNPVKSLDTALMWLERAEVIDDMKERQRLLRRVLMALLQSKRIRDKFEAFFREVDWNKVKLSKADKFHFRGKYFKVDLDKFEY